MPFLTGTMYMIALAGPFYIMSWLPARYLGVKLTFPTDPKIVVGKVVSQNVCSLARALVNRGMGTHETFLSRQTYREDTIPCNGKVIAGWTPSTNQLTLPFME